MSITVYEDHVCRFMFLHESNEHDRSRSTNKIISPRPQVNISTLKTQVWGGCVALEHNHHDHSLRIETGRYCRPKLLAKDRKCELCNLNQVEDETHFVLQCTLYDDLRQKYDIFNRHNGETDIENLY